MSTRVTPKTDRDLEMWTEGAAAERATLIVHIRDLEPSPGNDDLQQGFREGIEAAVRLLEYLDE